MAFINVIGNTAFVLIALYIDDTHLYIALDERKGSWLYQKVRTTLEAWITTENKHFSGKRELCNRIDTEANAVL